MQGQDSDWPGALLTVYVKSGCVYCAMVILHLQEMELDYEEKNVAEPGVVDELILVGGKPQTPFLLDAATGEGVYESSAIVEYLDAHYRKKED